MNTIKHRFIRVAISYLLTIMMGLLLFPLQSHAFTVKSHVWIAQQVLNDLDDNAITIQLGSREVTIPVDPALAQAIKNNKAAYRMGNVGPDAFPDMFTGQLVVHAGKELYYWKTDDWLKFLLESKNMEPADKAFVYGYLAHAASDVFAHTYVNHFSGANFDVTDGDLMAIHSAKVRYYEVTVDRNPWIDHPINPDENDIANDAFVEEERHITLERYIDSYLPPMRDSQGNNLGHPSALMQVPATFVRDRLIFNDEVMMANGLGQAYHLSMVHLFRKNLQGLLDGWLRELEIATVQGYINYLSCEFSDVCVGLNKEQAGAMFDVANEAYQLVLRKDELEYAQNKLNELLNAVSKYTAISGEEVVKLEKAIFDVTQYGLELTETIDELNYTVNVTLTKAIDAAAIAEAELVNATNELAEAEAVLVDYSAQLANKTAELVQKNAELLNTPAQIARDVCNTFCGGSKYNPFCKTICDTVFDPNPVYQALQSTISTLQSQITNLQNIVNVKQELVNGLTDIYQDKLSISNAAQLYLDETNQLISNLTDQRDRLEDQLQRAENLVVDGTEFIVQSYLTAIGVTGDYINGYIDFAMRATSHLNPIRAHLQGWADDITEGMRQYVLTSGEVAKEFSKNDPKPLPHITKWLHCWGTAVAGVPSPVSTTSCSIKGRLDSLNEEFEGVMLNLAKITKVTEQIYAFKQHIDNQVKAKAEELTLAFADAMTGLAVERIINVYKEPATVDRLNGIFGLDHSSDRHKGLLEIVDMASRINADMGLNGGTHFDLDKFSSMYNAVVLAKLALLDRDSLQMLAEEAGVPNSETYGGRLFADSPYNNILLRGVASLDGNHQWMENPPPYPRREGFQYAADPYSGNNYEYGYFDVETGEGFRLWGDCEARNKIFRQIFRGPMSASLETSTELGFDNLLHDAYQSIYPVSWDNAFPHVNNPTYEDSCGLPNNAPGANAHEHKREHFAPGRNISNGVKESLRNKINGLGKGLWK